MTDNRDRNLPKVLKDVCELGNEKHKLLVRIIRYQHPLIGESRAMLDIRRYHKNKANPDGTSYTGFGHGVSLTSKDIAELIKVMPEIANFIQEADASKISTKG